MPGNGVRLPVFPAIYWGVYHLEWTLYPLAGLIPRPHDTLKHKPGIKTGWNMLGYEMNYNTVFFAQAYPVRRNYKLFLYITKMFMLDHVPPTRNFNP